jgi:Family of unknown function (DUF6325)
MANDAEPLGPISYLIVEFPGNKMNGKGLPALIDLVDRGLIRILDLQFVTRDTDGTISGIELSDLGGEVDLTMFEGVSSGLMDQSDFEDASAAIEPGSSAAILIFENRWAANFVQTLRDSDAQLVAAGYIPLAAIAESLDALE